MTTMLPSCLQRSTENQFKYMKVYWKQKTNKELVFKINVWKSYGSARHFIVLCFSGEQSFEVKPITWSLLFEVDQIKHPSSHTLKESTDSDNLRGENHNTFTCTSFVLQLLRGSVKQDHFEYESLCINHTKNVFLKKVFTFLHLLSLSFFF